jgi:serine/threonine protein kinase/WD40 repeat protein
MLSEDFPAQLTGFRPGSLLAGYRLEAKVGAGGMAVVYRARDEHLGRLVALKLLAPSLAADEEFRRRFLRESRATAVDDPHIIPVYEAREDGGVLFIAMKFVPGGDLRQVLEREGALPLDQAADFISPVASALDAAHAAGLVHRDVKPGNILVDTGANRPDHVYLSDFGIAKDAASSVSMAGIGTPYYMAPEQFDRRTVDGRADQYALACVTFELLTGKVPFEGDMFQVMRAHTTDPPPSLAERRPDLPATVDQVVAKAMAKAPEKRYESCGDFADALREALGLAPYHRRGSVTAPSSPPLPATPPSDVPPSAAAAIAPADAAVGVESDPGFAAASDRGSAIVDSLPGGGSAGVAAAPAPIAATGPRSPGREADDDAGTAGPRRRRLRRHASRKRRDPSPTAAAVAEEDTPAAAAEAESQPTGDLRAAAGPGELASPQLPTGAPPETPSLSAAVSVTPANAAAAPKPDLDPALKPDLEPALEPDLEAALKPDLEAALEPDLGAAAEPDLGAAAASDLGTAAVTDLGTLTVDSVPGGGSAGAAEVPVVVPTTGPGLSGGEADDDTRAAPPTAMMAVRENLPATPTAEVEAENPPTGDLITAAGWGELASPQLPVASPAETGPVRVGHETGDSTRTASLTVRQDKLTDPGSGTDVAVPARHPQRSIADRSGTMTVWMRRHRLGVFGLVCAILAAAATFPLVLANAGHSSAPGNPPHRGSSPGSPNPTTYSRADIDLPVGYRGLVTSLAFSPSGGTLAIAASGICLWDIATAGCIPGPRLTTAYSVAFSPDGNLLAAGDDINGNTYLWNIVGKRLLSAVLTDPASEGVDSVAFSPDGKILAAGDANSRTYLWNVATGKPIATLADSPSKGVDSVAFSPDGKILAAGDANGRTYLWNVATGKPIATLADSGGVGVESVAFSPDGKILAVGDANDRTYLWNVGTRNPIASLADSGGKGVESVAFSPDGTILAVGDGNGRAYLWNVATEKLITTLTDPGSTGINSVTFSPDGTLACGDENNSGNVYLWRRG